MKANRRKRLWNITYTKTLLPVWMKGVYARTFGGAVHKAAKHMGHRLETDHETFGWLGITGEVIQ